MLQTLTKQPWGILIDWFLYSCMTYIVCFPYLSLRWLCDTIPINRLSQKSAGIHCLWVQHCVQRSLAQAWAVRTRFGTLGCLFRISSSTTSVYLLHMENHDRRNPCLTRTGSRFQWYFSNCLEQTACWRKDLGILPKSEYSTSHAVLPLIKSTDHAILSMLPISFCFLQSCIRLSPWHECHGQTNLWVHGTELSEYKQTWHTGGVTREEPNTSRGVQRSMSFSKTFHHFQHGSSFRVLRSIVSGKNGAQRLALRTGRPAMCHDLAFASQKLSLSGRYCHTQILK